MLKEPQIVTNPTKSSRLNTYGTQVHTLLIIFKEEKEKTSIDSHQSRSVSSMSNSALCRTSQSENSTPSNSPSSNIKRSCLKHPVVANDVIAKTAIINTYFKILFIKLWLCSISAANITKNENKWFFFKKKALIQRNKTTRNH